MKDFIRNFFFGAIFAVVLVVWKIVQWVEEKMYQWRY